MEFGDLCIRYVTLDINIIFILKRYKNQGFIDKTIHIIYQANLIM